MRVLLSRFSQSLPVGLLAVAVLFAYWLPTAWWLWGLAHSAEVSLPDGLPFWRLVWRTCFLSLLASTFSIASAYPFVLTWRMSGSMARRTITTLMMFPLIMGLLARNYSWVGMLTNRGELGRLGRALLGDTLLFSSGGVVVVMATIFTPIAFFILLQGVRLVQMEQIEAARTLGLTEWRAFLFVVLPMTQRAAALTAGFTFALAVGFFVTPQMIGGGKHDFVGNAILGFVEFGRFEKASAIALAFLALMLVPALGIALFSLRRRAFLSGR